jgi:putative transcriptional regulator
MNTPMIKFDLTDALKKRGISKYRLSMDTKIAHTTIWKLETGRAQRIGFDVLEKICTRLECEPGDFLFVMPDVGEKKPAVKKATKKTARG